MLLPILVSKFQFKFSVFFSGTSVLYVAEVEEIHIYWAPAVCQVQVCRCFTKPHFVYP